MMPHASVPLLTPEDALDVVLVAVADPPAAETVVLMLDELHRGGTCLVCRGAASAEQVGSLLPLLVQAAAQEPGVLAAVVMATVRPGAGIALAPDDDVAFGTMRHELALAGVDLLDWFVLDGDLVASVAELSGACWRWTGEEPAW